MGTYIHRVLVFDGYLYSRVYGILLGHATKEILTRSTTTLPACLAYILSTYADDKCTDEGSRDSHLVLTPQKATPNYGSCIAGIVKLEKSRAV